MSGANDKTGVGAGSAEWGTPPELFARLNVRFAFDYDAFASHENALLSMYSTVDGTYSRWFEEQRYPESVLSPRPAPLRQQQVSERDGLTHEWGGLRVFMNPPYSRGLIEQCIEKAFNERARAAIIVALLPAATETRWFQQWILPYCHIDWLPKRVRYIDPLTKQPGQSPPSGSVIAVFKTDYMGRGEGQPI